MTEKMTDMGSLKKTVKKSQSPAEVKRAAVGQLVKAARARGEELTGPNGLLTTATETVLEAALDADDWLDKEKPHEAQTRIDVLCTHPRTPLDTTTQTTSCGDLEVRQTITRVIAAHLHPDAVPPWSAKTFDFAGAELNEGSQVDFIGAEFNRTPLGPWASNNPPHRWPQREEDDDQ